MNTLHTLVTRVAFGVMAMATGSLAHALIGNSPAPVPDGGSNVLLLSAGAVGSLLVIRRFLKK